MGTNSYPSMTVTEVSEGALLVSKAERVVTLTMNAPPMNPMGAATVSGFEQVIAEIRRDESVRVVVVTGAGAHFCAGANIKEFKELRDEEGEMPGLRRRMDLITALERLPVPVIARMRGNALGGGLELALGCHFRLADTTTMLGLPEVKLGTMPAWGGPQRLARIVPRDRALLMMLTGDPISAYDAADLGLITSACSPAALDAEVAKLAERLAGQPRLAVAAMLDSVVRGSELTLDHALDLDMRNVEGVRGSPDNLEGVRAFREKRPPNFS